MSRLPSLCPDTADTVIGCGTLYYCPTLDAIDTHLTRLTRRVQKTNPRYTRLIAALSADIDLLLERRHTMRDAG